MLISYNVSDIGMRDVIAHNAWVPDVEKAYRVYGLKLHRRPPIMVNTANYEAIRPIIEVFRASGLAVDTSNEMRTRDDGTTFCLEIGLRQDVRMMSEFAAKVVRSLVFAMEGKLEMTPDFRITLPCEFPATIASPGCPNCGGELCSVGGENPHCHGCGWRERGSGEATMVEEVREEEEETEDGHH